MAVWLHPERVTFAGKIFDHVRHVRIESIPFDPNAQTANPDRLMGLPSDPMDVQITIVVVRDIVGSLEPFDLPSASGPLEFEVALGRSDAHRQRIALDATLAVSRFIFDRQSPARHEARFLAVSSNGEIESLITLDSVAPQIV